MTKSKKIDVTQYKKKNQSILNNTWQTYFDRYLSFYIQTFYIHKLCSLNSIGILNFFFTNIKYYWVRHLKSHIKAAGTKNLFNSFINGVMNSYYLNQINKGPQKSNEASFDIKFFIKNY